MIDELYVLYRPIGCEDEASTDLEQGEKILCAFPRDQSLDRQLLRVSMLEGLIDFTSRFSSEGIHSVIMEKKVWAFMQPAGEEGLWFIAGAPCGGVSGNGSKQRTVFKDHLPSGAGIVDGLNRFYKMFVMLRGSIIDIIDSGLDAIETIQATRKKVRKLRIRRQQEQLDYENIRQDMEKDKEEEGSPKKDKEERVGIKKENSVSVELLLSKTKDTTEEIETLESDLCILVASPAYVVAPLRNHLHNFTEWFLQSKELYNSSGLQGIGGMHYCTVGHPAFQSLTLVRQAIEGITRGRCEGCLILYDGQVVWSDLDDESTYTLYDFVRMQEGEKLRDIVSEFESRKRWQMIEASRTKGSIRRKLSISGRQSVDPLNGAPPLSAGGPDFMASEGDNVGPEDWLQHQMDCSGFIMGDWGTVDLQDVNPAGPTALSPSGSSDDMTEHLVGRSKGAPTANEEEKIQSQAPCVEVLNGLAIDAHNVFFPPLFVREADDSDVAGGGAVATNKDEEGVDYLYSELSLDESNCEKERGPPKQVGRLLFYRQACFIMCLVMPELSGGASGPPSSENLAHATSEKASKKENRLGSITNFDDLIPQSDRLRCESSSSLVGDGEGDDEGLNREMVPSSGRFATEQDVIAMCGMLQRGLADVVDQLLVSLGKKYKHLNVYGLQWQGGIKPTPITTTASRPMESVDNQTVTTATMQRRTSMDNSNLSARRASMGGEDRADTTDTAAGNATGAALKVDPSLIVPIPPRPVMSPSGLPTGISAYYYNSCNRAAKAPGFYDRSYDPQLYWPMPVVCTAHDDGPIRAATSGSKAMSEVLGDRYLSDLLSLYRHRFPLPASLMAATLPAVLLEAFNDLRQNLSTKYSRTDSVCTEACLRLSSTKEGGLWALGRRSDSRYLFLAIEGCGTLQEMNSKVRRTTEGVFKRVVL